MRTSGREFPALLNYFLCLVYILPNTTFSETMEKSLTNLRRNMKWCMLSENLHGVVGIGMEAIEK